jgi:hypothetical protein
MRARTDLWEPGVGNHPGSPSHVKWSSVSGEAPGYGTLRRDEPPRRDGGQVRSGL